MILLARISRSCIKYYKNASAGTITMCTTGGGGDGYKKIDSAIT